MRPIVGPRNYTGTEVFRTPSFCAFRAACRRTRSGGSVPPCLPHSTARG